MTILKRTLAGAPAAMLVTAGLGVLMAGLIKVEHEALGEKPKQLSFVINEVPDELFVLKRKIVIDYVKVEVPPPPPVIATSTSDLPKIDLKDIEIEPPEFKDPSVEWEPIVYDVGDVNAQPIFRPSPIMPPRFMEGNNSGHCTVRFDVSAQGSPYNVVVTYCSSGLLKNATTKSVLKWKFRPKVVQGQAVSMSGVENKVSFVLLDDKGRRLPDL